MASKPVWTTACPDWEERIVNRRPLVPVGALYPAQAEEALRYFNALKIVEAQGQPTFGEAAEPWVTDIVRAIFGATDNEGKQQIREAFVCLAKKNGKSLVSAGIMLTALLLNWRHANELIILAPTKEAADNAFKPAAEMVRADPELDFMQGGVLKLNATQRTITHSSTNATLKVVAADSSTVVGKKAAFVLCDELWEFGTRAGAQAMWQEATGGLLTRPEGFVVSITTQSDQPPAGIFKAKLNYARKVRDGEIEDPTFLPIIYEFPQSFIKSKAYRDPKNFYITNPNLGRVFEADEITRKINEAEQAGPGAIQTVLAKHLNVEIGDGLRDDRWSGADFWARQVDPTLNLDTLMERSEVLVVGVDGGGLDDLFGLAVLGREKGTRRWLAWAHAWAHEIVLTRQQSIATKLQDFAKDGEVTIVSGDEDDLPEIVDIISEIDATGKLVGVCVDPAGLGELVDALAEIGIDGDSGRLMGVTQGYGLMNAIKTCERKLANRSMVHAPSAMMSWSVGNLRIENTATAIRATKQVAGSAKIDPVMAMFDAAWYLSQNPEVKGGRIDEFLQAPIMVI